MNSKRHLLVSAIVCCVAGCLSLPAAAQAYPTKPIRLVVPFGAGGVADLTARTVVQKMAEGLGQSVVIDNKPGAGGVVAGDAVAKAAIETGVATLPYPKHYPLQSVDDVFNG